MLTVRVVVWLVKVWRKTGRGADNVLQRIVASEKRLSRAASHFDTAIMVVVARGATIVRLTADVMVVNSVVMLHNVGGIAVKT